MAKTTKRIGAAPTAGAVSAPAPQSIDYSGWSGRPPDMTPDTLLTQLGSSGLRTSGGFIREEYLPQLAGMQAVRQYREMGDNSPAISGILFAITSLLRKVKWRTEPADDSPESAQMSEFAESLRHDMQSTWEDLISEVLSMFQYGFAPCEITYKRRQGYQPEGGDPPSSDYDDGLIGWESLRLLGQDTVQRWFFDKRGRMNGVFQTPWTGIGLPGGGVAIPAAKLLNFRSSPYKDNPEGRALDPETLIPTPDGWRRLDDMGEGDKVFDEEGRVRYVTARADWNDRPCHKLTFSDGSEIIADDAHQWLTHNFYERHKRKGSKVRTTAQIAAKIKFGEATNHAIAWAGALDYPEQVLLVHPYVLGLWLGDGNSNGPRISTHVDDLEAVCAQLEGAGYSVAAAPNGDLAGKGRSVRFGGSAKWASDGPAVALRMLGVLNNKHIPAAYLRGSIEQRLALLSGLMDSDGYVDHGGRCEFCNANYSLAAGAAELVRSLGIGARLSSKLNSHGNTSWLVKFTPTFIPFRLGRKAARCRTERQRKFHYIVAAEPVAARRTVCIEVDSPSHLFLAGESMVPTHNSLLRGAYRPFYMVKRFEEMEAIMFERMAGLPTLYMPGEILNKATGTDGQPPDPNAVAAVQAYRNLVANVRIDNWMGVVLPSDVYMDATGKPTSVRKYEFKLLTPDGGASRTGADADKQITRNNLLAMQSVLADFLALGHEVRGTQAAAFTKVDLFLDALDAALQSVAAVFNRQGLPRLWYLNALEPETQPTYQPDLAQRIDIDILSSFALRMAQAGMPLFPDADTEDFFRDAAGMPLRPEQGIIPLDLEEPELDDQGNPIGGTPKPPGGGAGAIPAAVQKSLRNQGRLLQQRMLARAKDRNRRRGVAA